MKKDEELPAELYDVARNKGTEAPFSGKYWGHHEKGMYKCAICGASLLRTGLILRINKDRLTPAIFGFWFISNQVRCSNADD